MLYCSPKKNINHAIMGANTLINIQLTTGDPQNTIIVIYCGMSPCPVRYVFNRYLIDIKVIEIYACILLIVTKSAQARRKYLSNRFRSTINLHFRSTSYCTSQNELIINSVTDNLTTKLY